MWRWVLPLSLLALCAFLYLWRLGVTPLEDFDEAYYAAGAKEMLERGDLGTPYYNGQPFLLKPVLIYWIIASAFRMFGETEFAARVGSAFLGALLVLMVYCFAARALNRRAAYFAGLALALNYMWIDIARDASIDIPLTAALTPALFLFFLAGEAPRPRRRWLYLAAYPLFGIALLAKGPVPTGVVVVGLVAALAAAGRLRQTLREAHLLPGLLLLLTVAAPWYVYELRAQPEFFRTFFINEHFGHVGGQLARNEPVWGNLRYVLVYFSPWALLLIPAFLHAFRQPERGHVLRFAAWWSLAVVVLFSIPKSKLAHYLAPAFPPLAILVGAWLDAWLARRTRERGSAAVAFALLGLLGAVCLAAAWIAYAQPPFVRAALARYGEWTPGLSPVVMTAALGVGFAVAALSAAVRRELVVPALVAGMLVAAVGHIGWFKERHSLIEAQPRKELAQYAAATRPAGERLGVYYAKRNATVYYFGRPIVDLGEWEAQKLAKFLRAERPSAAITDRKFWPWLQKQHVPASVLQRRGEYVLLVNGAERGGGGRAHGLRR